MTRRILFVDDEPKILQGFERQLSGRFEIQTAVGPGVCWFNVKWGAGALR